MEFWEVAEHAKAGNLLQATLLGCHGRSARIQTLPDPDGKHTYFLFETGEKPRRFWSWEALTDFWIFGRHGTNLIVQTLFFRRPKT